MSTAVRRPSFDTIPSMRRASIHKQRPSIDVSTSGRAAMVVTSAQTCRTVAVPQIENSYRLEPQKKFPYSKIKNMMKETMEKIIGDMPYDPEECTMLSATLADVIKQKAKEIYIPRYKIVTNVTIGQMNGTTVSITSRCLWNDKFDSYSEYTYTNGKLYAVGMVYGFYTE